MVPGDATVRTVRPGEGFELTVPYDVPGSLDALRGPRVGVVGVPLHVHPHPGARFDIAEPGERAALYSAVVRAGRVADQVALLDLDMLIEAWPTLTLPVRCRHLWEERLPGLRLAVEAPR